MRALRATVAALAAVILLGSLAGSASALPARFWGLIPQGTPTTAQLQRIKRGGADSLRIPILWASVQPTEGGPFHWDPVDEFVEEATTAGFEVLPYFSGAPSWAVAQNRRYGSPVSLPVRNGKQRSGWQSFLREAVLRYGPDGRFWSEHPGLPERPIRVWQIWNEQNFEYFVFRPNPAEYGQLVNLSFSAIRGVDGSAKILLGGMFAKPREAQFKRKPRLAYFAADFLQQMYRTTPGIRSKFQGVALHPYTTNYKRLTPYIEELRKVMKANHDGGKGLWITELGWSSQRPTRNNSFAKGPAGQAAQLKGAFNVLRKNQRKWRIQRIYWFSIDDQDHVCNFCNGSGLFGDGFTPKPAWYAFVKFAGGTAG
jgi:hypothetical protein